MHPFFSRREHRESAPVTLSLGVPGVQFHNIEVSAFWRRIRRMLHLYHWHEGVVPAGARARVDASAEDDGLLSVWIALANFHYRQIRVEAFEVGETWIGEASLEVSAKLHERTFLPYHQVGVVEVRAKLWPEQIRGIAKSIERRGVRAGVSPEPPMKLKGLVTLSRGSAQHRVEVELSDIRPFFDLYYLADGAL